MRKRKKTILIIIMILIVATLFMNNSVLAAPTAGITSAIGDSLRESTSEEKKSSNPSAAGMPSDVEEKLKQNGKDTTVDSDEKVSTGTGSDPIANPNFFSPTVNTATNASKLKDMANDIVGAIRAIGTVLAVVILIFMGYKYMIGSASDRADFKNSMIPYLTGAILLFTIPNLLGILYDLVKNIKL